MTAVRRVLGPWAPVVLVGVVGVAAAGVMAWAALRPGVDAAFEDRPPLPSCGTVVAGHGEATGPPLGCFENALAEAVGAELVVESSTVEGASVITYYRALPGERTVEVFVDATRDTFGSQEWYHYVCEDPDASDLPRMC
jgi:hypothetical protein